MSKTDSIGNSIPLLIRLPLQIIFAAHVTVAVMWCYLAPRGFSIVDTYFWVNSFVPLILLLNTCYGLWCVWTHQRRGVVYILVFVAVLWLVGSLTSRFLFPFSFRRLWLLGILFSGICFFLGYFLFVKPKSCDKYLVIASLAGCLMGGFIPWTQMSAQPSTWPINDLSNATKNDLHFKNLPAIIKASSLLSVYPTNGFVRLFCGSVQIQIEPFLQFQDDSPDGCWSILNPVKKNRSFTNQLEHYEQDSSHSEMWYKSGTFLRYDVSSSEREAELLVQTPVEEPLYSHLNSYCVLSISGHKELSLAFSPCPDDRIDVMPADYPFGRPARFAYMSSDGQFHVVEATSGEKGPFVRLARGQISREDELIIFVYDKNKPVYNLSLSDWAVQASTDLSPTAGWNVPVNSIEFQRLGDAKDSTVSVWMSLAATSVGRGWNTVGHSAGVYRNQIQIEDVSTTEVVKQEQLQSAISDE